MRSKEALSRQSYTILLCFLAYGMANLNILMSIGTILLAAQWLIFPGVRRGWQLFKENRLAVLMLGLYVVHLVWLFNTEDFAYAAKDLRIKLPLLILPLVIGGAPITRKQVKYALIALGVGIWVASIRTYIQYYEADSGFFDFREMVVGVNHIRLSLMMVLVFLAVIHYWSEMSWPSRFIGAVTMVNVIFFLNLIQSASGIIILGLSLIFSIYFMAKRKMGRKGLWSSIGITAILVAGGGLLLNQYYNRYFTAPDVDPHTLPTHTEDGHPYVHHADINQVENGHRVHIYLAEEEMVEAWETRSDWPLRGDENLMHRAALIRYLTSKNLTKDRKGVMALDAEDIGHIESGYPSAVYVQKKGLGLRLHTTMFGYHLYKISNNADGSSLFQRLVYWQTAIYLIKEHFWLGTGTGDVKLVFEEAHAQLNTSLAQQFWLRAHNQFLTFFVSFGILGFIYFLLLFIWPFNLPRLSYIHLVFLIIFFVSCITEDTLETQAGVTFAAFFYALFSVPKRTLSPLSKPHPY